MERWRTTIRKCLKISKCKYCVNEQREQQIGFFFFRYFTALPCVPDFVDVLRKDLLIIEIDCDNRKIGLINERTKKKFELQIDLERYPLPWQIVFSLNHYNDVVRLHPWSRYWSFLFRYVQDLTWLLTSRFFCSIRRELVLYAQ